MTEALILQPDKKAFAPVFNRLAKALRAKDVDAATMQIYYDALSDLPIGAIEAAALELARTKTFFPTTGEWHQAAEAEQAERLRRLATESTTPSTDYECETCRDSGWAEETDDTGKEVCKVCSCRPHNQTYRRKTLQSSMGHGPAKESK